MIQEAGFLCSDSENSQPKVAINSPQKRQTRHKVAMTSGNLFSVGEVAKQLGMKTKTIREWCIRGKIPATPTYYGSKTTYQIHPKVFQMLLEEVSACDESEQIQAKRAHQPVKTKSAPRNHQTFIPGWQQAMEKGLMTGKPFSPLTVSYYKAYVEKFIEQYQALSIANLKTELLSIPAEQFGKKDKFYKAMASFGKYLIQEKILEPSFLDDIKALKPKRHLPPKRITVDEEGLIKLLQVCEMPLEKALVMVLASTGLRASECAHLKTEDLDLFKQTLLVRLGKGNKTRRVGLTSLTVEAIQAYLKERECIRQDVLFLNKLGEPIDRHGIRQRLERLGRLAGVKANPHALRRAFVTINANKGRPLQMLQLACGHSSITTTRSYCLTTEQEVIEAMKEW